MLEGKRIYVSDVHMGPKKDPQSQYDYTWLGTAEAKVFAEFLGYLNADEEVKEVILLGDTMDTWVCPVDAEPPTFKEIVDTPQPTCGESAQGTLRQ
jgi:UDP-2,3-diacylglucosamine pyrophosphatase LpxH